MTQVKKKAILFFVLAALFTLITYGQEVKEYEETLPFDPDGKVSIDTYKGTITVETWDKNEVYFHAKVEPDGGGWNSTSPEEQLERCEVRYRHSEDHLSLKSDYRKKIGWGSETLALVHYKIKMPATAKLQVDDYKSESRISNLKSDLEFETYKGRVDIKNHSGLVDVETYKGDVDVDLVDLKENCSFETYKGNFNLSLPTSAKFDFDFELGRKGDYSSDFEMMMNRYNSDDGDLRGEVNGGGPTIYFSTYKGELYLRKK